MTNSDSDEENAIRYGTPLEPYEEDEVPSKRKYQQQPDQFAVDAHGRRRFHGAFTGGFCAGFGNTVGTPEGWTPATFKSSRADKAQVSGQRPEDFMDEEDRGEFGIAPKHMLTQNEFSGRKRPLQQRYHDGPIPGEPVLEQLLRPVHETAAVRMLRAMGWRPGQGAGERVTKSQKKARGDQHRVYGCYMPEDMRQPTEAESDNSDHSDSSDSEFEYDTLFAPDDYDPYVLQRKSDRFGLGYSGLSRHSVLGSLAGEYGQGASKSHLVMKDGGKKVSIRGQAFGVGAMEADDEDIYATEDMSHYDFSLGGAATEKQKAPGMHEIHVAEGFVRARRSLPPEPAPPAPAPPRDYRPLPAGARRTRFEPTAAPPRDQGTSTLTQGFVRARRPLPPEPAPPRDYRPLPAGARRTRFEPTAAPPRDQGTSTLTQGFVRARRPLPPEPAPPRDYRPLPAGARRTRFEPTAAPPRDQGTSTLTQGFVRARRPLPPEPAPPRDYRPLPAGARRTRFEPTAAPPRDQGTSTLTQGFVRARRPLPPEPAPPRDYRPLPAGARRTRFEPTAAPPRDQGTSTLTQGFVRARRPLPPEPAPPRDYRPLPAGARRTRFEPTAAPPRDQGTSTLTQGFVRARRPLPPEPAPPRDYRPLPAGARRTRFEPTAAPPRDQGTSTLTQGFVRARRPLPPEPAPPRDYRPLPAGARRTRFEPTAAPPRDQGTSTLTQGFVRARRPLPPEPAPPRDYRPLPAGARRTRFEPTAAPPRDQGLGRHELSAEARGTLLGEMPIPKPDEPTEQTIDPVAKLLGRNVSFVTTDKIIDKTKAETEAKDSEDFISIKDSGKEITKVFKPFVSDPAKQARYEKYLKDKGSLLEKDDTVDRLRVWERNREISEFEQAAKLYKPLSGIMGDRFTHASEPDDALNPLSGVARSSVNRGQATPQQVEAAGAGAYGHLTRSEAPWRPESLVCKRFNVPEIGGKQESKKEDKPKVSYSIFNYMEHSVHDKDSFAKEQTKFSGSKSLSRETITNEKITINTNTNISASNMEVKEKVIEAIPSTSDTGFNKRLTVAEMFLKESEKDLKSKESVEVTETINKFDKMDLYKSIFLSDSENEDDVAKHDEGNVKHDNPTVNEFVDVPKNVERNLSPPRGIFANIDFDEINSWKRNAEKKAQEKSESDKSTAMIEDKAANSKTTETNNDLDMYGPMIPHALKKRLEELPEKDKNADIDTYGPIIPDSLKKRLEELKERDKMEKPVYRSKCEREVIDVSSSSSDSWVEANEVKSKKKKKKNKKHKKEKKSKHKKRDR